jgi:hypothetical protein
VITGDPAQPCPKCTGYVGTPVRGTP